MLEKYIVLKIIAVSPTLNVLYYLLSCCFSRCPTLCVLQLLFVTQPLLLCLLHLLELLAIMTVISYTDSYETTTILVNKQNNYFISTLDFLEGYYKTNQPMAKFVSLSVLKPETLSVCEVFTWLFLGVSVYLLLVTCMTMYDRNILTNNMNYILKNIMHIMLIYMYSPAAWLIYYCVTKWGTFVYTVHVVLLPLTCVYLYIIEI